MIVYLDLAEVLAIVDRIVGRDAVRDFGLLQSSIHRPSTEVFGYEAYPTLHAKAAALLHSFARNHALLDGNKCTAWICCYVMMLLNGSRLAPPDDEAAASFVERVARGDHEVPEIEAVLRAWTPGELAAEPRDG